MNNLKRICILGFAGAAIVAAGCTTLDPYTGEQKTSQAAKGAMIGAGIGALAGGAVGNYQDRQEMALRQELEGTGVSVTRNGDNITLNMPGNITFATNSSDLSADFYPVLNSVTKVLNEFNKTVVEVAGHTDSRGSDAYNQSLSERRANSVAAYLRSQSVIQERLITLGLGESRPVADNSTPEGQQANRRVELTLVPLTA
jgi:outer membrane protein OmpA-like peptidoglycan-associated protein